MHNARWRAVTGGEEKNHGYGHLPSNDLCGRDMGSNKTSGEGACSGPTKPGEIVVKHHKERQDAE